MQKTVSLFVICTSFLVFVGACVWGVAGAQEQPAPTPTPYVVEQQIAGQDGIGYGEIYTPTGPIKINPADLAQMQQAAREELALSREVFVGGPETLGGIIEIAGKPIQLPPNVFSEAFIVSATCEKACPDFPVYVLRYTDTDASVLVGANTGKVTDVGGIDANEAASNRAAFQWLVDALGKEGVTQ